MMTQVTDAFEKIAAQLPGYRTRSVQHAYAEAVAKVVASGGKLIVEGPTGVGKSLGYLVPAVLSGKKTLVVTANISLQDQLIEKDLPLIARALGPFDFRILKGRGNYLCLRRHAAMEAEATLGVEEGAIATWGRMTTTGDRKELPIAPSGPAWGKFSVSTDECLGHDCEQAGKCFALKANAAARTAQVVVANYHLLYLDAIVRAATDGESKILPDHEILILDECHEASSIARSVFGFDVSGHAVRRVQKIVEAKDEKIGKRIAEGGVDFFADLSAFCRVPGKNGKRDTKRRINAPDVANWRPLHQALRDAAALLSRKAAENAAAENHADARIARNTAKTASKHARSIEQAMQPAIPGAEPMAFYVEEGREGRVVLCGRPLDISLHMQRVYETSRTVVLTSATLSTGAADFSLVEAELGAGGAEQLAVSTPFDLAIQMIAVLPDVPDPSHRDYRAAVDENIRRAVQGAKGRTLVLCTSNAGVAAAAKALDGCGYRVLRQGEMPTAMLVDEFRGDVSSVLVGTTSLWRGTDVSGEALSCVILDKLPFEPWGDPIVEALREYEDKDGWPRYLARAVVQFRQGVGRLIRSEKDRGVVVVLDGRLSTKPYGSKFTRTFARGMKFATDVAAVEEFLT